MVASRPKPLRNKKKRARLKKRQELDESWKTVCCCLCADESTRQFLWEAMERYSILITLLSKQIGQAPEFEQWKRQGWLSEKAVVTLCNVLKQEEQFKGLPSRFYMSAQSIVKDTFEGWVKSQQRLSRKISGKKRWLKSVEEDIELAKTTDFSPEVIQNRAKEILLELDQQKTPAPQSSEISEDGLDQWFGQF